MAKAPPLEKQDDLEDDMNEDRGEATEGSEGAAPAEGGEAPKKSKKKLIIIIAAVLLIVGGIAGAYFGGFLGKSAHKEESAEAAVGEDGLPLNKPVFYTMPDFLINLNSTGKQTSFLKATIVLELAKESDVKAVEANMPRLLDAYNTFMRELRASDLVGSAGVQRLREELLMRANKSMAPIKINDVLFKEIIVQ